MSCYVPLYTPIVSKEEKILDQIVSRSLAYNQTENKTGLACKKITVLNKNVSSEDNCAFDLGVEKGVDVPFFVIVGFLQREQFQQQNLT